MGKLVDTRLFDDVLALLDEGNLSRAAARRNITQPAFSRRIRSFEDWVGIPLLDRQTNRIGLHPTLAANAAEIRSTIQRIEALRARLRDGPDGGRLVLATQHALAVSIVPQALAALHKVEKGLTARLRTMNREECLSFFVRGDADVLMIYEARDFPPLPFDDTIGRRTWMRDTLVPVCGGALRHRLDREGRPQGPFPMIRYPADSHFGRLIERNGVERAMLDQGGHVAVETAFSIGALRLAEAGLGVAWVPHSLCLREIASGDLVNLGGQFGQIALDVSMFFSRESAISWAAI
jgi:DNA-binding transcriptional LysR family regulator